MSDDTNPAGREMGKRTAEGDADAEEDSQAAKEREWSIAGVKIAACNYNEKIIEEKEEQVRRVIEANYSRIRDVEKELRELQFELKITAGPKKSVLELLRKKIEAQNTKVIAGRERVKKAKEILEAAEADLKKEEDVKDQLCQELNLVVQQSAHAQLDKLEQLTSRLEALSGGAAASCNPQRSGGDKPAAREVSTSSSNPFLDPPDLSHEDPSAGKLQADAKVAAAAASRAAREAEEARARHVSLPSSRPARARQREEDSLQRKNDKQGHCQQAKERQQKPKAPEGGGKFSGFDA